MFKSKANWTGAAMVAAGLFKALLPEYADAVGVTMPAEMLIMNGLSVVFLRLGISKNGKGA